MKLPFGNETFDIITAFETIYFWPDINEAFKQVYRALKGSETLWFATNQMAKIPKKKSGLRLYKEWKYTILDKSKNL